MTELLGQVRLGKALDSKLILPVVADVQKSVEESTSALISLTRIRNKDEFTYIHSVAVCALMVNLGRELGLSPSAVEELGVAGLLHDVGKMVIPDHVLNKPGKLTCEETTIMRSHAQRGYELLKQAGNLPEVALDVCLSHHEKIDGTGYPQRIAGERISLGARMGAICDVYDAMSANRPYKEAWTPSESLRSMFSWEGHFDQSILSHFIRSVGIYPVGSLVKLESGRLALVVDQHKSDLTKPIVKVFYDAATYRKLVVREIDLEAGDDRILSREDPKRWGFLDWDRQWVRMIH